MRVALDATPLTAFPGGIARYTAELSTALAAEFADDEFQLLSDQTFRPLSGTPPNLLTPRIPGGWLRRRWWSLGAPYYTVRNRIDVFHGTDFAVPYVPLRASVLTLLDLSPWIEEFRPENSTRVRRRTPWLLRAGVPTMVLTPSEAVRREAIEYFGLAPDLVRAAPLAASLRLRAAAAPPTAWPRFLYAGSLERRKNVSVVIEAWRALPASCNASLILAGRRKPDAPALPPEPGLIVKGEVSDEELAALYASAAAVVYPSLYEGFGLPVLEAMQCGALVIASKIPAVAEVAGDGAVLLEPRDPSAWREALLSALTNPEWAGEYRARGQRRAAEFSWARTARETMEVYKEARERFGG